MAVQQTESYSLLLQNIESIDEVDKCRQAHWMTMDDKYSPCLKEATTDLADFTQQR